MARPMILIKRPLLEQLLISNTEGVPVCALLRKHHLPITPPTLTKLLNYLAMAQDSRVELAVKQTIEASIFPEWLNGDTGNVISQEPNWFYTGRMPFGKWEYRETIA